MGCKWFPIGGDTGVYVTISLQVLDLLLKEWHKDFSNKVLIFTKSVKLLEMLEFHLRAQGQC